MNKERYTYTQIEEFILEHLYYSMGVERMVWSDYKYLIVPQLKKQIKNITLGFEWVGEEEGKYNKMDIDHVLREIKEDFELFGDYEGFSATMKAINGLGSSLKSSLLNRG